MEKCSRVVNVFGWPKQGEIGEFLKSEGLWLMSDWWVGFGYWWNSLPSHVRSTAFAFLALLSVRECWSAAGALSLTVCRSKLWLQNQFRDALEHLEMLQLQFAHPKNKNKPCLFHIQIFLGGCLKIVDTQGVRKPPCFWFGDGTPGWLVNFVAH